MAVQLERERQEKRLLPCHAAIPAHNLAREAQMGHGISARDPRFDHKQIICCWSNVNHNGSLSLVQCCINPLRHPRRQRVGERRRICGPCRHLGR